MAKKKPTKKSAKPAKKSAKPPPKKIKSKPIKKKKGGKSKKPPPRKSAKQKKKKEESEEEESTEESGQTEAASSAVTTQPTTSSAKSTQASEKRPIEKIVAAVPFSTESMKVVCPSCGVVVMTSMSSMIGWQTILVAWIILMSGCCSLLCCVPCCLPPCKDVEHRCPQCSRPLGRYRRCPCFR